MDANNDGQDFTGHVEEDDNDFTGFNKKVKRDVIYFNVFDNSIVRKSKVAINAEGWEGPIKTTHPKTKKEVSTWVERYDNLVAYIGNVERFMKEFTDGGKTSGFNITLLSGAGLKKKAVLQLTWCEPVLKRFLKVAPNIKWDRPIYISVFPTTRNNKQGIAVAFKQGEGNDPEKWTNVPEYWSRDKEEGSEGVPPGAGIPRAVHDEMDDSYDFKAQNNFLGKQFFTHQLPIIRQLAAKYGLETKPETLVKVGQANQGHVQQQDQGAIQQHTMEKQRLEQAQAQQTQPVFQPPPVTVAAQIEVPPQTGGIDWEDTKPQAPAGNEIMDSWKRLEQSAAVPPPPDDDNWD